MKASTALFTSMCSISALLISTGVSAQGALEEIVVTAQKRSENLQDVPITITAISEKQLDSKGIQSVDDLSVAVPGLVMNRQIGASTPYLRGIGAASSVPGQESPNAVYIDGVYIPSMTGTVLHFNNIKRIEVLKGPQGTLFGRNAAGGLINIITETPQQDFAFDARVGYGNFNTVTGKAYITGGLTENLAADLAVTYRKQHDGPGQNLAHPNVEGPRGESYGVRGKLLFTPSDSTTITLAGDYNYNADSLGIWRQMLPGSVGLDGATTYSGDYFDIDSNIIVDNVTKTGGLSLTLEQEMDAVTFKSISAYRRDRTRQSYDQDATPAPIVDAMVAPLNKSFSQEFQLSSNDSGPLKWIIGLFYLDANASFVDTLLSGAFATALGGTINLYGGQDTTSYAGYAQGTYEVIPGTNITLGVRYTSDEKKLRAGQQTGNGIGSGYREVSKTFKKVTWRMALDQRITDDIMGYVSYNRGFKSGAFNPSAYLDDAIDPEVIDAVEGGFKTDLFNHYVRFNLSAFYYWYKDIQMTQLLAGQASPTLLNAAKSTIKGIEGELIVVPTSGLTLSSAFTLLDAKYDHFPGAPYSTPNPAGGNIITAVDASGNRMIRSPKFTGTVSILYDLPTDFGSLGFGASYTYSGSFYWEADNRLKEDATHIVTADITAKFGEDERYYGRIYGRNLLSEKYSVYTVSSSVGDVYAPALPRTYGIEMGVKF